MIPLLSDKAVRLCMLRQAYILSSLPTRVGEVVSQNIDLCLYPTQQWLRRPEAHYVEA